MSAALLAAGILFTVAGIVAAWFINRHYANLVKRHLRDDKRRDSTGA
ncbi:MAG: hypothetical protein MPK62_01770 [Alphaproteobacteria bacterium]|nr:hypothetical protein [Alphaproteobacteria bacterium]MDA8029861.1 hypothetical protein [Alphaproteobacteria bacterium]